jgi:lysine decarboxylase
MLYALKESGVRKIAAPILSHKSFFNGCVLLGLTPVLFETPTRVLPCRLTAVDVLESLTGAEALFLTSPDYYGNVADLAAIQSLCASQGKPLVIDGAHGGHLHADKNRYAGAYADMWVDGVHKSLPALTQGAVVSAKGGFVEPLKKAVDTFRTTSPSYPIMGSVEYAVKYPVNNGLAMAVAEWKKDRDYCYQNDDYTKLCLFVKDGFQAEEMAHSEGIYPEFAERHLLCFYLSPVQTEEALRRVDGFALRLEESGLLSSEKELEFAPAPLLLQDISGASVEIIPLSEAEGRVSAEVCGLFPPCLPLLRKGEKITREKVDALMSAKNRFGVENDKIKVVAKCKESL